MAKSRKGILLLLICFPTLFISCWDEFEEIGYYSANVLSFGFEQHDNCPDIEDYSFFIDPFNGIQADGTTGKIFNLDSLPYQSNISSLFPTVSVQSSNSEMFFDDVLWEEQDDSVDFSQPVVLKNTSADGKFTKSYTVFVNVHQVNPDSMILEPLATKLPVALSQNKIIAKDGSWYLFGVDALSNIKTYVSNDFFTSWTELPVSGLTSSAVMASVCHFKNGFFVRTSVNAVLHSNDGHQWSSWTTNDVSGNAVQVLKLYDKLALEKDTSRSVLCGMIVSAQGDTCFARSSDGMTWEKGDRISSEFPIAEESFIKHVTNTGVDQLIAVGGINAYNSLVKNVWATDDGLNWVSLGNSEISKIAPPVRKKAILFEYDNYLVCYGGYNALNQYVPTFRISPDFGVTWMNAPNLWAFKKMPAGLNQTAVYVQRTTNSSSDYDSYFIYMFGGERPAGKTDLIWKAYQNKMLFDRR